MITVGVVGVGVGVGAGVGVGVGVGEGVGVGVGEGVGVGDGEVCEDAALNPFADAEERDAILSKIAKNPIKIKNPKTAENA